MRISLVKIKENLHRRYVTRRYHKWIKALRRSKKKIDDYVLRKDFQTGLKFSHFPERLTKAQKAGFFILSDLIQKSGGCSELPESIHQKMKAKKVNWGKPLHEEKKKIPVFGLTYRVRESTYRTNTFLSLFNFVRNVLEHGNKNCGSEYTYMELISLIHLHFPYFLEMLFRLYQEPREIRHLETLLKPAGETPLY